MGFASARGRHGLAASILILAAVAGCAGSGATRHFQFDMTPSQTAGAPVNLVVDRLTAVDPLIPSEIMVQASPTEIRYYRDALWASSMSELVREKLTAEFGDIEPGRPTLLVTGRIRNCGLLEDGGTAFAHVRIDISLRREGSGRQAQPLHARTYEVRTPLASDASDVLVTALSEALEAIARDIARDAVALDVSPKETAA